MPPFPPASPRRPSVAPKPSPRPATRAARTTTSSAATATILLVDDDSAVRESLTRVLVTEGWQVLAAANGEEALECLAQHSPDLLITDLCMAAVSGWDLLFHEALQRPHLPVFVITGLHDREVRGADFFAAECFPKPLDLDRLIRAVRHWIGPARAEKTIRPS